jgi:hypothetical protein
MARFGLFTGQNKIPMQEVEGDYMEQDGDIVKIFKHPANQFVTGRQVGAFHLDKNQTVKEL